MYINSHWPTAAEACFVGTSFGRSLRLSLPKPMRENPEYLSVLPRYTAKMSIHKVA